MKTLTIEQLAEQLNGKLWIKGEMKRIYLDAGYNTKKMSTKTYVFQRQDCTYGVSCTIDCPAQHDNWINKEQNDIIESISNKIDEIIEEFGIEIKIPEVAQMEDNSPEVQGYFLRWIEARVPINSYGKLAIRKRQQVYTYKGSESKTPSGFIALTDEELLEAIKLESSQRLFEYGKEPDFIEIVRIKKQQEEESKIKEAERQSKLLDWEKEVEEKTSKNDYWKFLTNAESFVTEKSSIERHGKYKKDMAFEEQEAVIKVQSGYIGNGGHIYELFDVKVILIPVSQSNKYNYFKIKKVLDTTIVDLLIKKIHEMEVESGGPSPEFYKQSWISELVSTNLNQKEVV